MIVAYYVDAAKGGFALKKMTLKEYWETSL